MNCLYPLWTEIAQSLALFSLPVSKNGEGGKEQTNESHDPVVGEMSQQFGALVALPEDSGSILIRQLTTGCNSSAGAYDALFWPLKALRVHVYGFTGRQANSYTQK